MQVLGLRHTGVASQELRPGLHVARPAVPAPAVPDAPGQPDRVSVHDGGRRLGEVHRRQIPRQVQPGEAKNKHLHFHTV